MKLLLFLIIIVLNSPVFSGVVTPATKWQQSDIRVCWASAGLEFNNCGGELTKFRTNQVAAAFANVGKIKKIIQSTIEKNYTIENVGIQFSGWHKCPKKDLEKQYDAVIMIRSSFDRVQNFGAGSSVGDCRIKRENGFSSIGFSVTVGARKWNSWNSGVDFETRIKLNALHEFGHLAGLNHEDYIEEHGNWLFDEKTMEKVDQYNPFSVMSYAFLGITNKYGLYFSLDQLLDAGERYSKHITHAPPSLLLEDKQITIKPILSSGDVQSLRYLYKK